MQIGLKTERSQLGQVKFKPARNLSWIKFPSTYLGSKSINLYLLQILQNYYQTKPLMGFGRGRPPI